MNFEKEIKRIYPEVNMHWLRRYLRICRIVSDDANAHNHHILPRWAFPEYIHDKRNIARISQRAHIIAHYCLYKAWGLLKNGTSVWFLSGRLAANSTNRGNISLNRILENTKSSTLGLTRCWVADDAHKELCSQRKIEFYSDPENRKRQSDACMGIKKSEQGRKNMSEGRKKMYAEKPEERKATSERTKIQMANRTPEERLIASERLRKASTGNTYSCIFVYISPFGHFSTASPKALRNSKGGQLHILNNCTRADLPLHYTACAHDGAFGLEHKGKTPRSLGFYTIPYDQYTGDYEQLNRVYLPEPTHVLSSRLNDYLSQHGILPYAQVDSNQS